MVVTGIMGAYIAGEEHQPPFSGLNLRICKVVYTKSAVTSHHVLLSQSCGHTVGLDVAICAKEKGSVVDRKESVL